MHGCQECTPELVAMQAWQSVAPFQEVLILKNFSSQAQSPRISVNANGAPCFLTHQYILLFLYFIRLTPIDSKGNELLVFSHDALDSSSSFCPPGTFKVFAPRVFCRKNSVQTNLEAPSQHKHHRLHRLCEVYQELVSQDKQRETSHIQTFDVFQHQVHAQGQYLVPHQGVFGVVSLQGHIALALLRAECTVI